MKFSITVLLVALLIVASVADAQNKRSEKKSGVRLSSSFCKYGKKKHKEGTVKSFSKYCVAMKCEKKGKKLQWVFRELENCICDLYSNSKPIKSSKKSKKCTFNKESGKKGDVLGSFKETCFNLVCKASKKKIKFATQTIPNCVCNADNYSWEYAGEQGADSWSSYYSSCGGSNQSPIDLISDISEDVSESPLVFKNFDVVPESMTLINSGHLATVTIVPTGEIPTVSGGGLDGEFSFLFFHFHWGSDSSQGTEHLIDGKAYPLELHYILYNNKYTDVDSTLGKTDIIAMLGFVFEVSENDNPAFDNIISQIENVEEADSVALLEVAQSLNSYINVDKSKFFRYNGSFTTPTCNEVVIWTVFKDPIPISEAQLEVFRNTMKDKNGNLIKDNFRPIQPLNGRTIQNITTNSIPT